MVTYLILGVALLVAVLLIVRWYESANPSRLAKALKWGFLGLGAAVALGARHAQQEMIMRDLRDPHKHVHEREMLGLNDLRPT